MRYAACPKCSHQPLPDDQSLPAACPRCGVILAKVGAKVLRQRPRPGFDAENQGFITRHLLQVPAAVPPAHWYGRCLLLGALVLWTLSIWREADVAAGATGSAFLHGVLLPFHEAGHVFLIWAGRFLAIFGGTLGQLAMPLGLSLALLLRRHDPFGAAVFLWLFGFSVIDMAVYMADAFDPKLILLGGGTGMESGGHDWINLFDDMGLLHRARGIGLFFGWVGKALMLTALLWAARIVLLQRSQLARGIA